MEVTIFITICICGIIVSLYILLLRKRYSIFKAQIYGRYIRFKVYVISIVDKFFRYLGV